MEVKKRLITAGFVFFVASQFLISLPAAYGLTPWLWPLTRVYETLGLKHRWSLFTHSHTDTVHAWYDVRHIVKISDAAGVNEEWLLPEYPHGFIERYLHAREIDYVKNLWATKHYTGLPLLRAHAKLFTGMHPGARFPLRGEVFQTFQRIRRPFSGELLPEPSVNLLFSRKIAGPHRVCSERDSL